ncbi:MAG: hypothetical protein GX620_06075 [Chloroflexi bacterium]|nr:hypothetical protein [Chloroflexota bacterium]
MRDSARHHPVQRCEWLLRGMGVLCLLVGLGLLYVGPLELYCFYLFEDGGRFHYAGFGFGSFMFAVIAAQIAGYYLAGGILVALGYGHLFVRRWAWALTLTTLWVWLVVGLPITLAGLFVFATSKDPSISQFIAVLPLAVIAYPALPLLLLSIYRSTRFRTVFEAASPEAPWIERVPLAVRGLCGLWVFHVIGWHGTIMLNGVFPLFGALLTGSRGIAMIAGLIAMAPVLIWGLAQLRPWAWWLSVLLSGATAASSLVTFQRITFAELIAAIELPSAEMAMFRQLPFLHRHPTAVAILPSLATLIVSAMVGRSFFRHAVARENATQVGVD